MAINWGSEFGSGNYIGKLGIETVVSSQTDTQVTIVNYVYYWTKYAVSDSNNGFYVDWDSYADTSIGAKSISHPSNSAWNDSNKTYIGAWTATFDKTTSAQTKYFSARFTSIEYGGGSGTHYVSFTVPALPTYTVNYNANGGSGAPSSQTKTHGVNLTLSSTKPTLYGHTFQGWGTSPDDKTVDYSAGGTYSSNTSITLYAIWKANTYSISYDANGGSGAPSMQSYTYSSNGTINLDFVTPTRAGYTFSCWSLTKDGQGPYYSAGQEWSRSNASNYTLYAVWDINTYMVSYNANGGSGVPSSQMKTHGVNLTLSKTIPTKTGYDFICWNTKSDGSGTSYAPGGTYTTDSFVILYAIWSLKTYTVSFNANGGSGGPENQTKSYGIDLKLSQTAPTRKGYKFLGWGTSSTDTSVDYAPGSTYTMNASVTLYAIWKKVENMAINQNGTWKKGMVSIGGKKGTPYIKKKGDWKKGGA